jgi:hypothetical protein
MAADWDLLQAIFEGALDRRKTSAPARSVFGATENLLRLKPLLPRPVLAPRHGCAAQSSIRVFAPETRKSEKRKVGKEVYRYGDSNPGPVAENHVS